MRSMTGCGRSQVRAGDWEVTFEIRTVNHRFLDIAMRLPRNIAFLEETVRQGIAAGLRRGHADVFLTVRDVSTAGREVVVDLPLAAAYDKAIRQLAGQTGRVDDVTAAQLLAMNGVSELTDAAIDEEAVTKLCSEAVAIAVGQTVRMREREGAALRADLSLHLENTAALRERIAERAPRVVSDYRDALNKRLAQLLDTQPDPARIAQEVALMADRCAIDEELSRLDSHIRQMRRYLDAEGEIGKKMDFLIQEMNRETNTIGSKASDAEIAQLVVNTKSEIEKLREQIQNVE